MLIFCFKLLLGAPLLITELCNNQTQVVEVFLVRKYVKNYYVTKSRT
jgi:hypothetical protein